MQEEESARSELVSGGRLREQLNLSFRPTGEGFGKMDPRLENASQQGWDLMERVDEAILTLSQFDEAPESGGWGRKERERISVWNELMGRKSESREASWPDQGGGFMLGVRCVAASMSPSLTI